eukprot:scaffold16210_cov33-Phaeocystis_antarctica.AAC.1
MGKLASAPSHAPRPESMTPYIEVSQYVVSQQVRCPVRASALVQAPHLPEARSSPNQASELSSPFASTYSRPSPQPEPHLTTKGEASPWR